MTNTSESVFQRKRVFTKLILERRLLTPKHKQGNKLEDHFENFNDLIRELESIGSKIDEEDKLYHLLLTLNEEYES